jgi:hypothetical protein
MHSDDAVGKAVSSPFFANCFLLVEELNKSL